VQSWCRILAIDAATVTSRPSLLQHCSKNSALQQIKYAE